MGSARYSVFATFVEMGISCWTISGWKWGRSVFVCSSVLATII